ncbi:MAG: ATP-binding cassette domain-containing protein [Ferruginibacter sp.]
MQIQLQKIVPKYLEIEKTQHSDIWNKEVVFKKGERIQIVAPSGSGKSTLIHLLYLMRNEYTGQILYDGKNLATFSPEHKAKYRQQQVSIVFQDLRLFAQHSAAANIEIKKTLMPFEAAASLEEMAAQLGITKKMQQNAGICSYGEQQRIAIIRALQQPFDFLFLDEPFSHLDENNCIKAIQLITAEATKRNAGIILADLHKVPFYESDSTLFL